MTEMEYDQKLGWKVTDKQETDTSKADKLAEKSGNSERIQAADALKTWVAERQPANAHILEQLEGDLRANRRLNEWGQFALEDLLRPPRRDSSKFLEHKIASVISLFRNIFLFIPVGVTWWAIERAAKAYKGQLGLGTEKNFLQVWLDGPTLCQASGWPCLTLTATALLDAFLILSLIVFTVSAQFFEYRADARALEAFRRDESEFQGVLVKVGLFLHGFRAITPSQLKSGLAEAVDNLRKSSEQLAVVAEKATDTLTQFAQVSTSQLEPAARRIDSIVSALGGAAASHEQMATMVRTLQESLGQSLNVLTTRIDDFGATLQKTLAENNQLLEASMRGLNTELQDVARDLKGTSASAREVAHLFRERI
jgi:hypothetical protein